MPLRRKRVLAGPVPEVIRKAGLFRSAQHPLRSCSRCHQRASGFRAAQDEPAEPADLFLQAGILTSLSEPLFGMSDRPWRLFRRIVERENRNSSALDPNPATRQQTYPSLIPRYNSGSKRTSLRDTDLDPVSKALSKTVYETHCLSQDAATTNHAARIWLFGRTLSTLHSRACGSQPDRVNLWVQNPLLRAPFCSHGETFRTRTHKAGVSRGEA